MYVPWKNPAQIGLNRRMPVKLHRRFQTFPPRRCVFLVEEKLLGKFLRFFRVVERDKVDHFHDWIPDSRDRLLSAKRQAREKKHDMV